MMRYNWFVVFWIFVIFFIFCWLLIMIIPNVSSLEDDQFLFCSSRNISGFLECIDFWNEVYNISSFGYDVNCTNETFFVNQTVFLDKNCTEEFRFFEFEKNYELEMAKINQGCVQIDIDKNSCKTFIDDAVVKASSNCVKNVSKKGDDINYPYIFGFFVLIIFYLIYKKYGSKIKQSMDRGAVGSVSSEIPPNF